MMKPINNDLQNPAGTLLLKYAENGCPVEVGRSWKPQEITVAVKQGPHISALALDTIKKIHNDIEGKRQQGFSEMVYWDEIKGKLGSAQWQHLKISSIFMIPHKSRKYRAILDLSFIIKIFGMEIPPVNKLTSISAPQESMQQPGNVIPIKSTENAPQDKGI